MNYVYVTWEQIEAMNHTQILQLLYACSAWKASLMVRVMSYRESPSLPPLLLIFHDTCQMHKVPVVLVRRYFSIVAAVDDPNLLDDLRFFNVSNYRNFKESLLGEKTTHQFAESCIDMEPYKPRHLEKYKNGGCPEPWNGLHRGALREVPDLADISMPGGSSVQDSWKWNYVLSAKKVVLNHVRYFNNPIHTPPPTHQADMTGREVVDFFFVNADGAAIPGSNSFPWSVKLAASCIQTGQWALKDGRIIPLSKHLLFYVDSQDVVEDRLMELVESLGLV